MGRCGAPGIRTFVCIRLYTNLTNSALYTVRHDVPFAVYKTRSRSRINTGFASPCIHAYTVVYKKSPDFWGLYTAPNPQFYCDYARKFCAAPAKGSRRHKGIRETDALRFATAVGIADGLSYCVALLLALRPFAGRSSGALENEHSSFKMKNESEKNFKIMRQQKRLRDTHDFTHYIFQIKRLRNIPINIVDGG